MQLAPNLPALSHRSLLSGDFPPQQVSAPVVAAFPEVPHEAASVAAAAAASSSCGGRVGRPLGHESEPRAVVVAGGGQASRPGVPVGVGGATVVVDEPEHVSVRQTSAGPLGEPEGRVDASSSSRQACHQVSGWMLVPPARDEPEPFVHPVAEPEPSRRQVPGLLRNSAQTIGRGRVELIVLWRAMRKVEGVANEGS